MREPAQNGVNVSGSATARWAYFGLGWGFFGLGLLGMFVPLLPTTPLMLLALWSFARSSRRFHHWLYHHRWFGPSLQDWSRYRVVPLWAKLLAWSTMAASTTLLFLRGTTPWPVLVATVVLVAYAVWFLARCPGRRPRDGG